MDKELFHCIDAGSEYCPCYLAETMNCITCSHLQDENFCNCNWRGICIYQEFYHCGNKLKETRDSIEVKILNRENINNVVVFTIEVPHTLARQLNQPGAYIFVRNADKNHFFDTPMSIMESDTVNNEIKIAVQINGVKTKTIRNLNHKILIRGPYWNGLYGLENLKNTKDSKCLFITKGVAQAPALLVIKHLLTHNNRIDVILDSGSINHDFITKDHGVKILGKYNLLEEESQKTIQDLIIREEYNLIFIGASDYVRDKIIKIIPQMNSKKIVTTNNNEICCGEGICGSCTIYDLNGTPIKTCKTQMVAKGTNSKL